jgi:hypothetical protein
MITTDWRIDGLGKRPWVDSFRPRSEAMAWRAVEIELETLL